MDSINSSGETYENDKTKVQNVISDLQLTQINSSIKCANEERKTTKISEFIAIKVKIHIHETVEKIRSEKPSGKKRNNNHNEIIAWQI